MPRKSYDSLKIYFANLDNLLTKILNKKQFKNKSQIITRLAVVDA
jgi:hypothetical protein